jgi:hypothetical protein
VRGWQRCGDGPLPGTRRRIPPDRSPLWLAARILEDGHRASGVLLQGEWRHRPSRIELVVKSVFPLQMHQIFLLSGRRREDQDGSVLTGMPSAIKHGLAILTQGFQDISRKLRHRRSLPRSRPLRQRLCKLPSTIPSYGFTISKEATL